MRKKINSVLSKWVFTSSICCKKFHSFFFYFYFDHFLLSTFCWIDFFFPFRYFQLLPAIKSYFLNHPSACLNMKWDLQNSHTSELYLISISFFFFLLKTLLSLCEMYLHYVWVWYTPRCIHFKWRTKCWTQSTTKEK